MAAGIPGAQPPPHSGPDDDGDKIEPARLILKLFFLIVAVGLALSSALGLWIGLTQVRHRRLAWSLSVAGTLIPVGLLLL
jgi:hypothetical protein